MCNVNGCKKIYRHDHGRLNNTFELWIFSKNGTATDPEIGQLPDAYKYNAKRSNCDVIEPDQHSSYAILFPPLLKEDLVVGGRSTLIS